MPVDTKKLFNEDLPGAMERNKADALAIGAKYQMNVTGAGEWFIDCSATGPSCTAGTNAADCTITLADEDFQKLYDNPQAGMQLYMGGKLKVAGNPMLAMKLQKLFALKLSAPAPARRRLRASLDAPPLPGCRSSGLVASCDRSKASVCSTSPASSRGPLPRWSWPTWGPPSTRWRIPAEATTCATCPPRWPAPPGPSTR